MSAVIDTKKPSYAWIWVGFAVLLLLAILIPTLHKALQPQPPQHSAVADLTTDQYNLVMKEVWEHPGVTQDVVIKAAHDTCAYLKAHPQSGGMELTGDSSTYHDPDRFILDPIFGAGGYDDSQRWYFVDTVQHTFC